jgi:hypothetical protein
LVTWFGVGWFGGYPEEIEAIDINLFARWKAVSAMAPPFFMPQNVVYALPEEEFAISAHLKINKPFCF